jgi:hypothetical protein
MLFPFTRTLELDETPYALKYYAESFYIDEAVLFFIFSD